VSETTVKKIRRVEVDWETDKLFCATNSEGSQIRMDVMKERGGSGEGITPVEAVQAAAGACTGIDLVHILIKMRQEMSSLRISTETTQAPEHPMYFTSLKMIYHVEGENIEPHKLRKAIDLSANKYCSVKASLRPECEISTEIYLNGELLDG
jgi:putative redox protein